MKICGGKTLGKCVTRIVDMLISHYLQTHINFSGKNMSEKVEKELGSIPNRPLGFKDTLLHVVKSELTTYISTQHELTCTKYRPVIAPKIIQI